MNNGTKTCYICGQVKETQNGVIWGRYFYCDECFKNRKCQVDAYHCPSIDLKFKSKRGEETKLFFGIELETTKGNNCFYQSDHVDDIFYIRKNYKELDLNFEKDGSIGNGMEIITQPMTYEYIKENKDKFKDILAHLVETGNYSHDGGKCGLHVHVSRNALGETDEEIKKTIEKLMLFVETYRPKVEKFARRKHNEFSHYNSYTIPYHKEYYGTESCFSSEDYYKSGKLLYELHDYDGIGHSSVVNTNNSQTIEFRMFRGTLKFETFMATIEFINNLVNVCKDNQASKISWNKVINYGGDYIKEYTDNLDLLDDGLYLRDYTQQLEDIIDKKAKRNMVVIENYKKDLNDIGDSILGIVNEKIDFTTDNRVVRDTMNFRNDVYSTLSNILIDDVNTNDTTSLYTKLKEMSTNYSPKCKDNLKSIKTTLKRYISYDLTETTIEHVKETIKLIDTKLQNMASSEC